MNDYLQLKLISAESVLEISTMYGLLLHGLDSSSPAQATTNQAVADALAEDRAKQAQLMQQLQDKTVQLNNQAASIAHLRDQLHQKDKNATRVTQVLQPQHPDQRFYRQNQSTSPSQTPSVSSAVEVPVRFRATDDVQIEAMSREDENIQEIQSTIPPEQQWIFIEAPNRWSHYLHHGSQNQE